MAKKFMMLLVSAVLVLSLLLSACSDSGKSDKGSGADKEKAASDTAGNGKDAGIVQLPVFVIPSSKIENLETNSVTKYIEDKFNIKFKFEVAQGKATQEIRRNCCLPAETIRLFSYPET
ncbi:hypothetical protein LJK88_36565 [Paenibacillus sp. P26]|nr:hypothetical protein LJK88_36565 [Paenibacillus sp. P26]